MDIERRTVLVSGGASGLGAAVAARLAAAGAAPVVLDRRLPAEPLEGVLYHEGDVTDEAAVRAAIAAAPRPLAGAVTCAGILRPERTLGRDGVASLEAFRQVMEVNVVGTFNVVRLAAERLAEQGEGGAIVTTSSIAATDGQVGQVSYAASKGAVASMTLPLARELARAGIRVVTVAPGVFETPMMAGAPEKVRGSLIAQTAYPTRFGDPDEFAALVEHVFANDMLNGSVIRLDAGMRMAAK